jgi:mRNA deadenylase 3'-5' endonuclease subunit Ccr4
VLEMPLWPVLDGCGGLPNADVPSDHLPLCAQFALLRQPLRL